MSRGRRHRRRGGFFLIICLVVLSVATLGVYSFTRTMVVMDDESHLRNDAAQAAACVDSAGQMLRVLMSMPPDQRAEFGGVFNNPAVFRGVPIAADDTGGGFRFTIVAPGQSADGTAGGVRFGLIDESSRLNVNALPSLEKYGDQLLPMMAMMGGEEVSPGEDGQVESLAVRLLMALPGMTTDTAEAILDWIDADDEPRELGAESETYVSMPTPYAPTNGPVDSVEDLLLVRGVTPELMFGADLNRNGVLDPDEQQRTGATVDTPGVFGWASMLTAHGSESDIAGDGMPRINANMSDMEMLDEALSTAIKDEDVRTFVVAYRIAGQPPVSALGGVGGVDGVDGGGDAGGDGNDGGRPPGDGSKPTDGMLSADGGDNPPGSGTTTDPRGERIGSGEAGGGDGASGIVEGGVWGSGAYDSLDLTGGAGTPLRQILDLVDASVVIQEDGRQVRYTSPISAATPERIAELADKLAVGDLPRLPGRLNLNTAPAELLYGIPAFDESTVQSILEERDPSSTDPIRRTPFWIFTEGLVSIETMRAVTPIVCGDGAVYRAQIVGYRDGGGAARRAEIILDAHDADPQILMYRDLTHLGRGFDLTTLGGVPDTGP